MAAGVPCVGTAVHTGYTFMHGHGFIPKGLSYYDIRSYPVRAVIIKIFGSPLIYHNIIKMHRMTRDQPRIH
jgi:hypothetical protein